MANNELNDLFQLQHEQFKKLQEIANASIKEEESILNNLLHPPEEITKRGDRISDKVARFGGSWMFIIVFLIILVVWIIFNSLMPSKESFDPYPFILMNLILSCIAALQAPVIMMSQNRQEEKDRKRAENDYLINLKAEIEIRSLHKKMDLLFQEQIKTLYDIQLKQLELLKEICDNVKQPK